MNIRFNGELQLIGHISVDSGLCWIGDPCYILFKDKLPEILGKDWSDFCKTINKKFSTYGHDMGYEGLGVCVSTGYGDGNYPVYALINCNRVMGTFIDFNNIIELNKGIDKEGE
jgi:hypothetical protein